MTFSERFFVVLCVESYENLGLPEIRNGSAMLFKIVLGMAGMVIVPILLKIEVGSKTQSRMLKRYLHISRRDIAYAVKGIYVDKRKKLTLKPSLYDLNFVLIIVASVCLVPALMFIHYDLGGATPLLLVTGVCVMSILIICRHEILLPELHAVAQAQNYNKVIRQLLQRLGIANKSLKSEKETLTEDEEKTVVLLDGVKSTILEAVEIEWAFRKKDDSRASKVLIDTVDESCFQDISLGEWGDLLDNVLLIQHETRENLDKMKEHM